MPAAGRPRGAGFGVCAACGWLGMVSA